MSLSTTWRTCGSTWWTWRMEPSGDEEPDAWLTPHPRDPQPQRERERVGVGTTSRKASLM